MTTVISIIIAIIIFCIIIIFHEFGHFSLAKLCGVRVNEFALGLGPNVVSWGKGETKYCIKAIPFGGMCAMEGEDEDSDDPRAFNNKSVWARIAVVFAGPFFNFILAFIFAFILISCIGYDKPVLSDVIDGYAAQEAGLQAGDEIVRMNHKNIHFYREISAFATFNPGETAEITYIRDGEKYTTTLVPIYSEEEGRYLYGFVSTGERVREGPLSIVTHSFYEVSYWIYSTVQSLRMLVTGLVSVNELSGPVGIVASIGSTYTQSVQTDGYFYAFLNMLNWAILISANLGVMNLLPLPALDGGRLVFLIIEVVRGKRVPPEKEGLVHGIGIILLILLMVAIMFNDIRKLVMGLF